jgi:hypothetical protein
MALVELYHVVADIYPVDSAASITEGNVVMQNPSGNIVLATSASGTIALGIAGDNKLNTGTSSGLPGAKPYWQNRVSDPMFDETAASGKITVYHSGGKFATDQYDTTILDYAIGDALYSTAAGKLSNDPVGGGNAQVIGYLVGLPGPYMSGVPGTDINGDMSLGNYLVFKLII